MAPADRALLDKLIGDVADFRVDVSERLTRLETLWTEKTRGESSRWMKAGVMASLIGVITMVALRAFGL